MSDAGAHIVARKTEGDVAVLTINNPPVNALGIAVRQGLADQVTAANADPAVKAIVITGTGKAFSAGADITEFSKGRLAPFLPDVINLIEQSPKPVVAAINGLALGGGLEVLLGCHYRVASAGREATRPAGSEDRPPAGCRRHAAPAAPCRRTMPPLDMITSGAPIPASKALELGLVDKIATGDVVAEAVAFANELIARGAGPKRVTDKSVDASALPATFFDDARKKLARHPSGPLAPLKPASPPSKPPPSSPIPKASKPRARSSAKAWRRPTPRRCSTPSSPNARPATSPASATTSKLRDDQDRRHHRRRYDGHRHRASRSCKRASPSPSSRPSKSRSTKVSRASRKPSKATSSAAASPPSRAQPLQTLVTPA